MKLFDNFESNLETVIGVEGKMSIFSNYLKNLPSEIGGPLAKLCVTDTVLFAVEYHELSKKQKRLVNAMLKVLNVTSNQCEFTARMNAILPNLM